MEFYSREFEQQKTRKLTWRKSVGTVRLTVEVDGRPHELEVTPVLAAIISAFEEKDEWSFVDLGERLGLPSEAVQKKAAFWCASGVLQTTPGGLEVSSGGNMGGSASLLSSGP